MHVHETAPTETASFMLGEGGYERKIAQLALGHFLSHIQNEFPVLLA
jgi:hypothetical protein